MNVFMCHTTNTAYEPEKRNIEYPALYFPDYYDRSDLAADANEEFELHYEFSSVGNDTKFKPLNEVLKQFIPLIKLYNRSEIPEEAFKMILDGYISRLKGM